MSLPPAANRIDFSIVDEDEEWMVVDKPAPLLVHPTRPGGPRTLWDELRDLLAFEIVNGGQVSLINRLDRETSGLVLVAKSRRAAGHFGRAMAGGGIRKAYQALVWGWPEWEEFRVDEPILRQGSVVPSRIWLRQTVHPKGSPSRTDFRVLERLEIATSAGDRFAVVEAVPHTGRMHQIRVHLSHAGHPVVGDKIYGPDEGIYLRFVETGFTPELRRAALLERHALHSTFLACTDPNGTEHRWHSPFPRHLLDEVKGSDP